MKKNTIKAFTLVEMLIVIVIIGILIAALMPRIQSAQWRARDVARKNDLSQIQTAIVTSQQDKWDWPGMDNSDSSKLPTNAISVREIEQQLLIAWMSSVPWDPLKSNQVSWIWTKTSAGSNGIDEWEYGYVVVTKNWTPKWWFVLMAKTEIEWWSNWIYCWDSATTITSDTDISAKWTTPFQLCTSFIKDDNGSTCQNNKGECTYSKDDQLRYIVTY